MKVSDVVLSDMSRFFIHIKKKGMDDDISDTKLGIVLQHVKLRKAHHLVGTEYDVALLLGLSDEQYLSNLLHCSSHLDDLKNKR